VNSLCVVGEEDVYLLQQSLCIVGEEDVYLLQQSLCVVGEEDVYLLQQSLCIVGGEGVYLLGQLYSLYVLIAPLTLAVFLMNVGHQRRVQLVTMLSSYGNMLCVLREGCSVAQCHFDPSHILP